MNEEEVRQLVRERMSNQRHGAFARSIGVAQGQLSLLLRGKIRPPKKVLAALGLVAVVDYRLYEAVAAAPVSTAPARKPTRLFRYGDWPAGLAR